MKTFTLTAKFVLITLGILFFSCEKDDNSKQKCLVISSKITAGGADTSTIVYTYNADNKLIKNDLGEGAYHTYTWEATKITAKFYTDNTLDYTETYTLDENGHATSSTYKRASDQGISVNTTYEYDADGYLISKTVTPTDNTEDTDYYTYEYEDGNLLAMYHETSSDNYSSETTYLYYTDKENNIEVSPGFLGKADTNLVKKSTLTTTTAPIIIIATNYTYEFEPDGKVKKMTTAIGSGSPFYTIPVYHCN